MVWRLCHDLKIKTQPFFFLLNTLNIFMGTRTINPPTETEQARFADFTKSAYAYDLKVNFWEVCEEKVKRKVPEEERRTLSDAFRKHGVDVAVDSSPKFTSHFLDHFTGDDWKFITDSSNQLLGLYTVVNHHEFMNWGPGWGMTGKGKEITRGELATARSLPLVYSTSLDALRKIMAGGKIVSERRRIEELEASGGTVLDHEAQGASHTHREDREVGLDDFVFTHYGKLHANREYGGVHVLLDPDLINSDGAFATRNDIMDIDMVKTMNTPPGQVPEEGLPLADYLNQVSAGPYFFREVVRKIKSRCSGDFRSGEFQRGATDVVNNIGMVVFSTWEVKVREASVDDITGLVFTDADEMQAYKAEFGGKIPCKLNSGEHGPSKVFSIAGKRNEVIRNDLEEDYESRRKFLDAKPAGELVEVHGYMSPTGDLDTYDDYYNLTEKSNFFKTKFPRVFDSTQARREVFLDQQAFLHGSFGGFCMPGETGEALGVTVKIPSRQWEIYQQLEGEQRMEYATGMPHVIAGIETLTADHQEINKRINEKRRKQTPF